MTQPVQCPVCKSTQIIRKGTTAQGIQKYRCRNPACRHYFRETYYQPPFATHAAYMRAYRKGKHHDSGGRRIPAARLERAQQSLEELAPLQALLALPYPSRLIGSCLVIHADTLTPDLYALLP